MQDLTAIQPGQTTSVAIAAPNVAEEIQLNRKCTSVLLEFETNAGQVSGTGVDGVILAAGHNIPAGQGHEWPLHRNRHDDRTRPFSIYLQVAVAPTTVNITPVSVF